MKIEKIFCDICGKEGAYTQRKDAKQIVLNTKESQDKTKIANGKDTVYVTISFAKNFHTGGIGDLDLCKSCNSEIINAPGEAILNLFRKAKKNRSSKSD